MHWMVVALEVSLLLRLCGGQETLYAGYGLSPSSYHVCNGSVPVLVNSVVSYLTSSTERRPCGGWLFWRMCEVTLYRITYHTKEFVVDRQIARCCDGYVQMGSHCVLPLGRSREFTAKPGHCPGHSLQNRSDATACDWDTDCPGWQKCCQAADSSLCSNPVPLVDRDCYFNVTITVKTNYHLLAVQGGILNHTRLLHSLVTGALDSPEISVHYISSWPSGSFTTSSALLVGSSDVFSAADISSELRVLIRDVEEVTNVKVQDVDECLYAELHRCSPWAGCTNTQGSHFCTCQPGFTDLNTSHPGVLCQRNDSSTSSLPPNLAGTTTSGPLSTTSLGQTAHPSLVPSAVLASTCGPLPQVLGLRALNVTDSSFCLSWTVQSLSGLMFRVTLLKESTVLEVWDTAMSAWEFTSLQAGVLYTAEVTVCACGGQGPPTILQVKTDAQVLEATARLTNMEFTSALHNPMSEEYKNFIESFQNEILLFLPLEIRLLLTSGQVQIQINSFSPGSVLVNFTILFLPNATQDIRNVSSAVMGSLLNSSKYTVDRNSTQIYDVNECLTGTDCSPWAECVNTWGSYTCACGSGFTDVSLDRPGRLCTALLPAAPMVSQTHSTYSYTAHPVTGGDSITSSPSNTSAVPATGPGLTSANITPTTLSTAPPTSTTMTSAPPASTTMTSTPPTSTAPTSVPPTVPPTSTTMTSAPPTSTNMTTAPPTSTAPTSAPPTSTTMTTAPPTSTTMTTAPPTSTTLSTNIIATIPGLTTNSTIATTSTPTMNYIITTTQIMTQSSAIPTTLTPTKKPMIATTATAITNCTMAATAVPSTDSATAVTASLTTNSTISTTVTLTTNSPIATTTISPVRGSTNTTLVTASTAALTTSLHTAATTQTTPTRTNPMSITAIAAHQTTTTTAPPMSYPNYITVECLAGFISVSMSQRLLPDEYMAEVSLYLGHPGCGPIEKNASHVLLTTTWDTCNTTLSQNSTTITAQVTLYGNVSSSMSAQGLFLDVPIICTYRKSGIISMGYSPSGYYDMIQGIVEGSGSFHVAVRLLNGTSPLPQNYTLSRDEVVVVEVAVNTSLPQIKVVINKCWATSTSDHSEPTIYVFLDNNCAIPDAYTTVLQNGNSSTSLLSIRIFSFVNLSVVYLHCQIQICVEMESRSCIPNCLENSLRSRNMIGTTKATCGPYHRSADDSSTETVSTIWIAGFSILGIGLFFLFIAGVAGFISHRRKIGVYDFTFKSKQENFTYHVFDT